MSLNMVDWDTPGIYEWHPIVSGVYKIECWGAQGADRGAGYGGRGGYAATYVNLLPTHKLYITVGDRAGKYGGGGRAGWGGYGGGASDVRVDENTIYDRIIVAGGGGTCGRVYDNGTSCAFGGGINGGGGHGGWGSPGGGGTQTGSGGPYPGSFGKGGNGVAGSGGYGGGGGGGWYGGGGASVDGSGDDDSGGGGGSGYVLTDTSIKPAGYQDKPLFYCLSYLGYTPVLISGNSAMPNKQIVNNADGSAPPETTVGNSGNGLVRITLIKPAGILYFLEYNGYLYSTTKESFNVLKNEFNRIPKSMVYQYYNSIIAGQELIKKYNWIIEELFNPFTIALTDGTTKTIKPTDYFDLKLVKIFGIVHDDIDYDVNQLRVNYNVNQKALNDKCQIQLKDDIYITDHMYDRHFEVDSTQNIRTLIKKYDKYYGIDWRLSDKDNIFTDGIIGKDLHDYNIDADRINLSIVFTDNVSDAADRLKSIKLIAKTGNNYKRLNNSDIIIRSNQDKVFITFKEAHNEVIINKLNKKHDRSSCVNSLEEF